MRVQDVIRSNFDCYPDMVFIKDGKETKQYSLGEFVKNYQYTSSGYIEVELFSNKGENNNEQHTNG